MVSSWTANNSVNHAMGHSAPTADDPHPYPSVHTLLLAIVSTIFILGYRRLYHHPLSSFPGPRLAALTRWYGFYYEVVQHGAFLKHKTALHDTYGDIVRVGPNELSFRNPRVYGDIYAPGSRFTKDPSFYNCLGISKSSVGLCDPVAAKERREVILPFFSRRAVVNFEHAIREKVNLLVQCLLSHGAENKPVNLFMAFRCATLEIIMSYCLNHSPRALETPGFQFPFLMDMHRAFHINFIFKYIPAIHSLTMDPPDYVIKLLPPNIRRLYEFRRQFASQLDDILANPDILRGPDQRGTIYHHLIDDNGSDSKLKNRKLTREELLHEALALLTAGSDTVGHACNVGFFHVLNNKAIYHRLLDEIDHVWPDKDSETPTSTLEKLPYLTAVIKESLRMSHGVVSNQGRVVGPTDSMVAGVLIPAGTVISTSSTYVHLDPTVFPNPHQFNPDRWLDTESKKLDTYLVSFSRGPRSCFGINLAWSELYMIFGTVFRHIQFSIHDTTEDDLREFDDFFIPVPRKQEFSVTVAQR